MNQPKWPKLGEVFPEFAARLKVELSDAGYDDLAKTVDTLDIRAKCDCGEDECASFYTASPHITSAGNRQAQIPETIELEGSTLLLVDVIDDKIVFIENLHDPEFKKKLDIHFLKGRV